MAPNDRPRDMANDIVNAVRECTKPWNKTRKSEERAPASRQYRYARMTRERGVSFKDAAAEILPKAYAKVSGNGKYPANARQLMYAARPHIQEVTVKPLLSNYFTQTLLPDYINETGVSWDVIFDARGHFHEPHNGEGFGVGTLEVRKYLSDLCEPEVVAAEVSKAKVTTSGPSGNFGAALFIEKEGFDPLLKASKIAERFDIAIMSTKGMSVTAARELVDKMCHDYDVPLLLLRDFDKAGFSIAGTLQRDTRRYEFENDITVIDLGLSLADVNAMQLATEHQHHAKGTKAALMDNMRENGASEAEIAFMFQDFDRLRSTRRVELNAMTSPQFIAFLERKLRANGVAKIVPDRDLLSETYVAMQRGRRFAEAIDELVEEDEITHSRSTKPPKDLAARVHKYLKKHPEKRWDDAVDAIVSGRAR
jgi:DNA topoisomerase 6 subunit A-like protein